METAQLLKKSRFYLNTEGKLIEHIANYKNEAIFLKSENLRDSENVNISLISLDDIIYLKKVNGNKIRKLNPSTITEAEKMLLLLTLQFND